MWKLREMLPNDPGILISCARMSLILKDTDSGFADLRRADEIRALEDFADLSMLGDLAADLQDLSIAVSIFDRVLTLEPHAYPVREEYASVFHRRGALKTMMKQFPDALEDLNMAVKLDPDNTKYLEYRAALLMTVGRPDAALADIEAVHLYDPADAEMLPYRAAINEALTRGTGRSP